MFNIVEKKVELKRLFSRCVMKRNRRFGTALFILYREKIKQSEIIFIKNIYFYKKKNNTFLIGNFELRNSHLVSFLGSSHAFLKSSE